MEDTWHSQWGIKNEHKRGPLKLLTCKIKYRDSLPSTAPCGQTETQTQHLSDLIASLSLSYCQSSKLSTPQCQSSKHFKTLYSSLSNVPRFPRISLFHSHSSFFFVFLVSKTKTKVSLLLLTSTTLKNSILVIQNRYALVNHFEFFARVYLLLSMAFSWKRARREEINGGKSRRLYGSAKFQAGTTTWWLCDA